jgi:hypothetical protein
MREAATEALGGEPDLWHIHNHSLGKNGTLPQVVNELAASGEPLLLQPHDFAEDGRPANYSLLAETLCGGDRDALAGQLYPAAPHLHYAVLNSRDASFLARAGAEQVHLLPNAVCLPRVPGEADATLAEGRTLTLYPTRAIRRKNLGEFLLWAALAGEEELFAATLAPKNPNQAAIYNEWVRTAGRLGLRATFEVGTCWGSSFGGLLRRADRIITTSVGEGFGLAFLEPCGLSKPLFGRALPEVTDEFEEAGVDLSARGLADPPEGRAGEEPRTIWSSDE